VIVYVSEGVPELPQASMKMHAPRATPRRQQPRVFLFLELTMPAAHSTMTGKSSQVAALTPEAGGSAGLSAALLPVVLMVSVELAVPFFGVTEDGLNEHVGALAGEGDTEQLRLTARLEVLAHVTGIVAVAEPPGLTVDGESVPVIGRVNGTTAPPFRVTVCGLSAALSVMLTAAVRVPGAVGAKVTVIVQEVLGATVVQLFVCLKSLALVPVIATVETTRFVEYALLLTVTVCAVLVVPRACAANCMPRADRAAVGGVESRLAALRTREAKPSEM